jgi:hypothetical protein
MRRALLSASTFVVTLAVAGTALAGPPLICHPFDIGTARSLPIGPADGGWSSIDRTYDRSRLVTDTLALLTPSTPTLVRMETLRRATMYVTDDVAAAGQLLQALRARASKTPATRAEALAGIWSRRTGSSARTNARWPRPRAISTATTWSPPRCVSCRTTRPSTLRPRS